MKVKRVYEVTVWQKERYRITSYNVCYTKLLRHELACHGLNHACKIDPETKKQLMSVEEFEQRTLVAKKMLEKISGEKLVGYRAPNALVGGWMVDSLEKLGFKYDSSVSVNSFYNT